MGNYYRVIMNLNHVAKKVYFDLFYARPVMP